MKGQAIPQTSEAARACLTPAGASVISTIGHLATIVGTSTQWSHFPKQSKEYYVLNNASKPRRTSKMATIILADDEDIIRTLVRRVLQKAGHKVHEARDGQEALDLYPTVDADLVITDMIMPGKDGGEAIAELIRNHPEVRIIAMSGGGRGNIASILSLASELGARRTLAKPFTLAEFMNAVNDTLEEPAAEPSHN